MFSQAYYPGQGQNNNLCLMYNKLGYQAADYLHNELI